MPELSQQHVCSNCHDWETYCKTSSNPILLVSVKSTETILPLLSVIEYSEITFSLHVFPPAVVPSVAQQGLMNTFSFVLWPNLDLWISVRLLLRVNISIYNRSASGFFPPLFLCNSVISICKQKMVKLQYCVADLGYLSGNHKEADYVQNIFFLSFKSPGY